MKDEDRFILSKGHGATGYYAILNKHNMSDLYVVKANIPKLKNIYETKISEIKQETREKIISMIPNRFAKLKLDISQMTDNDIYYKIISYGISRKTIF